MSSYKPMGLPESIEAPNALHSPWDKISLGVDGHGSLNWDTTRVQNLFVLGGAGTGKTILQNTILRHLNIHSDKWKFYGFSFKPFEYELGSYKDTNMYGGVSTTIDNAVVLMDTIMSELEKRWNMIEKAGVSHVNDLQDPPCYIMVLVDDFFSWGSDRVEDIETGNSLVRDLSGILQEGKELGAHVVANMSTFTGSIYEDFLSYADMRVILGELDISEAECFFNGDSIPSTESIPGRGLAWDRTLVNEFQAYYTPYPWEDEALSSKE